MTCWKNPNHNVKIWFLWCRLGFSINKVLESKFHLSKEKSHKIALLMASSWDYAVNGVKSLCCGNECLADFKVFVLNCVSSHGISCFIIHLDMIEFS